MFTRVVGFFPLSLSLSAGRVLVVVDMSEPRIYWCYCCQPTACQQPPPISATTQLDSPATITIIANKYLTSKTHTHTHTHARSRRWKEKERERETFFFGCRYYCVPFSFSGLTLSNEPSNVSTDFFAATGVV